MSKAYQSYAETPSNQIEGDKATILNALEYYHAAGMEPSAKDLAQLTRINHSTVRDAVIELREEHDIPVANLGQGYFIISSEPEFRRVMEHIEDTIETKRERQQLLARLWYSNR